MLKFKKAIRINLKSKHKIMVFGIIEKKAEIQIKDPS
jgi:hypothetical protein